MVRAVAADGYDAVTVRLLIALAGVSRRSFYEQFAGKQECFLATFDEIAKQHIATARRACALTAGDPAAVSKPRSGPTRATVAHEPEAAALVQLHPADGGRARRTAPARGRRQLGTTPSPHLADGPLLPAPNGASSTVMLGGIYGIVGARRPAPEPPARGRFWNADLVRSALAPKLPLAGGRGSARVSRFVRGRWLRPRDATAWLRSPDELRERSRTGSACSRAHCAPPRTRRAAAEPRPDRRRGGVPVGAFFELFEVATTAGRRSRTQASGCWRSLGAAAESGPASRSALRETLVAMLAHLAAHPLHARASRCFAPCGGPSCRSYGARTEASSGELLAAVSTAKPRARRSSETVASRPLPPRGPLHPPASRGRRALTLFALAPDLGAERTAAVLLEAAEPGP